MLFWRIADDTELLGYWSSHSFRGGCPLEDSLDKILLTVAEAAVVLGVSRALLYDKVKSGEVRSIKLGGARRIPREELDDYVARLAGAQSASA